MQLWSKKNFCTLKEWRGDSKKGEIMSGWGVQLHSKWSISDGYVMHRSSLQENVQEKNSRGQMMLTRLLLCSLWGNGAIQGRMRRVRQKGEQCWERGNRNVHLAAGRELSPLRAEWGIQSLREGRWSHDPKTLSTQWGWGIQKKAMKGYFPKSTTDIVKEKEYSDGREKNTRNGTMIEKG